jgi:hypothetical protein
VIIPVVVSLALLGGLIAFADAPRVVLLIAQLDPLLLLVFIGIMVIYHAIRALQWLLLLNHLDMQVGMRSRLFSYLGGSVSMYLPGGSYFQNYLLYETRDADPAESAAATTVMTLTEPLMAMLVVFVIGIDDWRWLRWALGIGVPVISGGLIGIVWWLNACGLPNWLERRKLIQRGREQIIDFVESLGRFRSPLILSAQALIAALYLVVGGVGLWIVELMLRLHQPAVMGCIAGYCFALAASMLVPLFTNLGSLEVGGVVALIASGASRGGAVAMMIFDRALIIGASFLFLLIAGLFWRDLVVSAFRRRGPSRVPERTAAT